MRGRARGVPAVAFLAAAVLTADVATVAARAPASLSATAPVPGAAAMPAAAQGLGQHARRVAGSAPIAVAERGATRAPLPRPVPVPTRLPYAQRDRLNAYRGLGAWVDVFDYAPDFQDPGEPAEVTPETVGAMAAAGVRTLYIQAARADPRSPGDLVHPALLGAFVQRAHAYGMRVVAWYLPTFVRPELDLRRLVAVHRFRAGGHRVDGLAVDIEWVRGVRDTAERNRRLVELSRRLRTAVGSQPLGAIVLPPVDTEIISPRLWPAFPWQELGEVYDVWLPMAYWTTRTGAWRQAARYTDENIRRIRVNVGANTPVHAIGGIGDRATPGDYRAFVRAARASKAIGVSIYDWDTAQTEAWQLLRGGSRPPG